MREIMLVIKYGCDKMKSGYIFSLVAIDMKNRKYSCFCILSEEFGGIADIHKHENGEDLLKLH